MVLTSRLTTQVSGVPAPAARLCSFPAGRPERDCRHRRAREHESRPGQTRLTLLGSHSSSSRQRWWARWISSASTFSSTCSTRGRWQGAVGAKARV